MTAELNKRLDYLINDLKVYEDFTGAPGGKRHAVKNQLFLWKKDQEKVQVIKVPQVYKDLKEQAKRRKGKEEVIQQDWRTFQMYPSTENHLRIEDGHGQLLIYRLPIPLKFTDNLARTEHLIPPGTQKLHSRGNTSTKYWGLWRKYMVEPRMTVAYTKDLPYSQQWLDANQPFFQHMSNILRLLDPKIYKRYLSILEFLPEGLHLVCGAWYTCAILRGMTGEGTPHQDVSDYLCGFNANTAWGDYTMTKMVFWELGISVEVKKGEAILFLPRILTHNAVDIQGGVRHVLDAFVHQNVLLWKDKKH
jgi:hypothetical protein